MFCCLFLYQYPWLERNQPNGISPDVTFLNNVLGFHRTCEQHILIDFSRCLRDPKKTTIYEYSELNSKSSSRDYEAVRGPVAFENETIFHERHK